MHDGWMTDSPSSESRPGWLLDEVSSAGRENLDATHVERYDDKEDASAPDEVALLHELGLGDDSIVVDLGAGTGQFTLAVAPHCGHVVAVDVSPVMLRRLRTKIAGTRRANVAVAHAGFLTYEHVGQPADFVYSRYALHHLPDFWKGVALARMRKMLRPGGVLRLWDVVFHFDPADATDRIEAWCATGTEDVEGDWTRAELEEHVRDEHSTYTWLLEAMIERGGFEIERALYSDDGVFARYVLRAC
jgi:ubiquinone/menaquinone biosynthesis C-methylase UbiE